MSYQVLARKWRPHTFRELVGQTHVLRALVNALDRDQLHHAYLFTGTRGVGKTTIARILARCLNCETGVSSEPCGTCSACTEIGEGRFVDLIEVDAASRTKVEDTRELLENVQYAPVRGRFKVYLIDEVHMLSTHSFNALLKTLEEPPPHVKFLLATTDPQKLPATVLSRCLQFHLKNMSPENIVKHLDNILTQEMISFDTAALNQLAYAAEGSMRDALSLTDQAIAFGGGEVKEQEVRDMLGSIDRGAVWKLLTTMQAADAAAVLEQIANLADHSVDFIGLLEEVLHCLHLLMREQLVPGHDAQIEYKDELLALAEAMPQEQVQLFYQIALNSRKDIAYAPTARQGFEVAALRMIAFKPMTAAAEGETAPVKKPKRAPEPEQPRSRAPSLDDIVPGAPLAAPEPPAHFASQPIPELDSIPASPESFSEPEPQFEATQAEAQKPTIPVAQNQTKTITVEGSAQEQWLQAFKQLSLSGVVKSLASMCEAIAVEASTWSLVLDEQQSAMLRDDHAKQIATALAELLGDETIRVNISLGTTGELTPAKAALRLADEQHAKALQSLNDDPLVKNLIENFDARIIEDSVRYIEP